MLPLFTEAYLVSLAVVVPCKFSGHFACCILLNNKNLRQERTEKKLLFDSGGDTKACQKTSIIKKKLN